MLESRRMEELLQLGQSRRDHAARLMKLLRGVDAHVMGVVVNGFRPDTGRRRGDYYDDRSPATGEPQRWRRKSGRVPSRLGEGP